MTRLGNTALMGLLVWLLAGCSSEQAPVGRWEGHLESSDWILAVRLQVEPGNTIRATALSVDVSEASLAERAQTARTIKRALIVQWQTATRGDVRFSNNILTRKSGTAPLFVYSPEDKSMTFNFYAFGKLTKRVYLEPVEEFTTEAVN
jgi:hypothetical protein